VAVLLGASCGKKGPPLPPLVKLPQPGADLTAGRHGDVVDLQFTVPSANTDGTRPANVERVDVFAVTAAPAVSDDQMWKQGTKIGSVRVQAPRDPNQTIEPDEPLEDVDAPQGPGLEQGAAAHLSERLTALARQSVALTPDARTRRLPPNEAPPALLGPPPEAGVRTYALVGVSTRGRRGPFSKRVTVPLLDPPPTLAPPEITYDEQALTVTWAPIAPAVGDGLLPSTPIGGTGPPTVAYNVYEVSRDPAPIPTRLTKAPIAEPRFVDPRVVWGARRCYTVRAVLTVGPSSFEGDEPEPRCVTLVDRFPPAAPKGLNAVPSEGAISLIWEPNAESDVRGYIILRAVAPGDALQPITPAPVTQTTFKDVVGPGVRYVYAVRAVDAADNQSAPSARVEETAR
jgi:hypothetical protein